MGAQAAGAELGVKVLRLPVLALSALLIGAAPPKPIGDLHAADRIRAHVEFLASDLLEGRGVGTGGAVTVEATHRDALRSEQVGGGTPDATARTDNNDGIVRHIELVHDDLFPVKHAVGMLFAYAEIPE